MNGIVFSTVFAISLLIISSGCAFASTIDNLLPTPMSVEALDSGDIELSGEIVIAAGSFPNEAQALARGLREAGVEIAAGGSGSAPAIVFTKPDASIVFTPEMKAEGYSIIARDGMVRIFAETPAGAFYAVQTLLQLVQPNDGSLKVPAVRIIDRPALGLRGVTDDISRGQVPLLSDFKRTIDLLARWKMNAYFLYMEDMFKFEKYPTIGEGRGALSREEIAELEKYAAARHVELIPIFETLGHMENILMQPEFAGLAEFPGAFCVAPMKDESYIFLGDLFSEIVPAFKSEYFHIGADESWDVGLGASKDAVAEIGIGGVHLAHYKRVFDLLRPYNRKIMMYGDMLLKHPEIIPELPSDTIVFDWEYSPLDHFGSLDAFEKAGLKVIVSPGVSDWQRFFPDYKTAEKNIYSYINQSKGYPKTIGAAVSSWGDFGHENFRELNLYGYALAAEASWADSPKTPDTVRDNFFTDYLGAADDDIRAVYDALTASNRAFSIDRSVPDSNMPLALFRQSPILPTMNAFHRTKSGKLVKSMGEVRERLSGFRSRVRRNAVHIENLEFAARRIEWMARKTHFANSITWHEDNSMKKGAVDEISALMDGLAELKNDYSSLWKSVSRPEGLKLIIDRFDNLSRRFSDLKSVAAGEKPLDDLFLKTKWIAPPLDRVSPGIECGYRRSFTLDAAPESAAVQLAADGYAALYVNGSRIGDVFGRMSLSETCAGRRVSVFTPTELFTPGENTLIVKAASWDTDKPGVNVLAEFAYPNGRVVEVVSDSSWEVTCVPEFGWDADTLNMNLWWPAMVLEGSRNSMWNRLSPPDIRGGHPSAPDL